MIFFRGCRNNFLFYPEAPRNTAQKVDWRIGAVILTTFRQAVSTSLVRATTAVVGMFYCTNHALSEMCIKDLEILRLPCLPRIDSTLCRVSITWRLAPVSSEHFLTVV